MQDVTPEKVWEAVEGDPSFIGQIPEGKPREAWRGYLAELVPALAPHFADVVGVKTLIDAKVACLRHVVDSGFMRRLIESYPEDALGGMSAEEVCDAVSTAMNGLMPMLEGIAADVPSFLEENGVTEGRFMTDAKVGLRGKALAAYRKGTLTIGELLCLQPAVILKNTD